MDVKVDINQLINDLSMKLGVAAEKVYGILYKQMIIDGIWSLVWALVSVIGMFITYKMWGKFNSFYKSEKEIHPYRDWMYYPERLFPLLLATVVLPILFFSDLKLVLDYLINPDWQIIKYILNQINM